MTLTESAAVKINQLTSNKQHLRLFVTGGGCSGFEYGFSFEENIDKTDEIIKGFNASLIIDKTSFELLKNTEVDYQTSLSGESFVLNNPDALSTCGCGKSFTPSSSGDGCGHTDEY